MFFLIRVAFWLSIVILLLPTGKATEKAPGPQIATSEALSAAGAAVSDMRQFCARQPGACEVGSHAAAAFGQKAQASAKMIYEFFTGPAAEQSAPAVTGSASAQDTLSSADRVPAHRVPRERSAQKHAGRPS